MQINNKKKYLHKQLINKLNKMEQGIDLNNISKALLALANT